MNYSVTSGILYAGDLIVGDRKATAQEIIDYNNSRLVKTKEEQLLNLIVEISTNKRFYADPESRTDLMATIIEAQSQGATDASETMWKTPDGIVSVTLAELKEASKKALEAKAEIIGVS